jgi:transcriptional regulator with XRE-family HTH domain
MVCMPSALRQLIRDTRKAKGIKLRELARRIGKSPALLVKLESDSDPPSVSEETLVKIAEELDLSADRLLALARKLPEELQPEREVEIALYRKVKQMPEDRQHALLDEFQRGRL